MTKEQENDTPNEAVQIVRLKARSDFLRVAQGGARRMRGLVVQARRQPGNAPNTIGLGFTVTRKVGNAVTRNRVRRRLREAARLVLPVAGQGGVDYVVIGRQGALDQPFPALMEDLRKAITKADPYGKPPPRPSRPRKKGGQK